MSAFMACDSGSLKAWGPEFSATILTLGMHARLREKLLIYLLQIAWLLRGCPEHWGLPQKCLRKSTVNLS